MAAHEWRTPLGNTAFAGDSSALEAALADPRADPSACHGEALRAACAGGHLPTVERLLGLDEVRPSVRGRTDGGIDYDSPLTHAARGGHLPVVDRLLADEGVSPTEDACAALLAAVEAGHHGVVERLLVHPRIGPKQRALLSAAAAGDAAALRAALADPEGATRARAGKPHCAWPPRRAAWSRWLHWRGTSECDPRPGSGVLP
jgi:hypothetical protein